MLAKKLKKDSIKGTKKKREEFTCHLKKERKRRKIEKTKIEEKTETEMKIDVCIII